VKVFLFAALAEVDPARSRIVGVPHYTIADASDSACKLILAQTGDNFFWIKDEAGKIILDNFAIQKACHDKANGLPIPY
jgi:hypothetical protein